MPERMRRQNSRISSVGNRAVAGVLVCAGLLLSGCGYTQQAELPSIQTFAEETVMPVIEESEEPVEEAEET